MCGGRVGVGYVWWEGGGRLCVVGGWGWVMCGGRVG